MKQTRKKLRSPNLHLTKKHKMARKRWVMLLVGDFFLRRSVTSVIILPMVLPAWLIKKRYITHMKNHLTLPNLAKGSETNFIYINISRPPAKTKWKRFNALFVENVFRKNQILGNIVIISTKTFKVFLVYHVVKSLEKSTRWAFILKSNTLILTCPFRNGVVRYARNHSPFQEP